MQLNPFDQFVELIRTLLTPFQLQDYAIIVAIIPFLIIIYLLYLITVRVVKISFRRVGMPQEATTSIVFIVRLVYFGLALIAALAATNFIVGEGIIAFGALIGTAIGLAFSRSLGNLVSGLYLFASRPFRVGDYVRIGHHEGLVTDITLNYTRVVLPDFTRQYIPNARVIESELTNFRIRIDDYLTNRGEEYKREVARKDRLHDAYDKLKFLTKGEEIYRYTFEIYVHKDFNLGGVREKFDELCAKWEDKFLQRPEYFYYNNQNFGVVYRFGVIVQDPKTILTDVADFSAEVAQSFQT